MSCQTCAYKHVKAINEDLKAFLAAKDEGNRVSWTALIRLFREDYKYPYKAEALRGHARRCLGRPDI